MNDVVEGEVGGWRTGDSIDRDQLPGSMNQGEAKRNALWMDKGQSQ